MESSHLIDMDRKNLYQAIYRIVKQIPVGCVATYGQIADRAGYPGYARQVGYALHVTPENLEIPWHRVINAKGEISLRKTGPFGNIHKILLEAEGIQFDINGKVPLDEFMWVPPEDIDGIW